MKITCDSCGAKYTIADDKVRGRKVKIRCKGCGTAIVVDGQQDKAAAGGASEPADSVEGSVPVDLGAGSSPPPAEGDGQWSVNLSETDQRTLSTQEVVDGWKRGEINAEAFVWKEGMADWLPIQECAELKPLLTAAKPASGPNRASATPAARVTGGRSQPGADLFGSAFNAGADADEEDPATAAPPPARPQVGKPPTPGADEVKPTGARNENSVLFSLDALKAGFAGPSPKQEPPKRASERAGTDDLLGAPTMSAPGPMFSLADNSALLTAPAPPEPPKPKVVEAFAPAGGGVAPQSGGSKKLVIALSVLLVLVIGGGAAALSINSKNREAEVAAAAASASAAIQKAKEEEAAAREAAEKAREEKRQEEERARAAEQKAKEAAAAPAAAGTPAASASASASSASSTSSSTASKPGGTTGTTSGSGTKKDEKKKDEPAPAAAGSDQPFSKAAAVSALSSAAGSAGSCKKLGGPTGTGRVTVTFAPSGRVTTANVEGAPFAGTSVGGCVASLFRKAHIPAFSGNAVTVSKSFSIN